MKIICVIKNCSNKAKAKDMCLIHYKRVLRHGDPLYGTPEQRFWAKVKKTDYCWIWQGKATCGKSRKYGQFSIKNKSVEVHRFSWQLANGPIPKGMNILHKCDNPICVNPDHLFIGTNLDNIKDKMAKGRWKGGRPKFTPHVCPRCKKIRQIVKGFCHSCYITLLRRKKFHRKGRDEFSL